MTKKLKIFLDFDEALKFAEKYDESVHYHTSEEGKEYWSVTYSEDHISNEFILQDRIQKIQQIIGKYGEENFYISFSGGKDSVVLHNLIDMALPDNKIPRVYCNTGIEYKAVVEFVRGMQKDDDRIVIIRPQLNIVKTLQEHGYPFKSKHHSEVLNTFQVGKRDGVFVQKYMRAIPPITKSGKVTYERNLCPKKLLYQFDDSFSLRVSDKCCLKMKEEPLNIWAKEHEKPYSITGIMRSEGGRRDDAQCLAFKPNKKDLKAFQPLVPITKEWEDWFISEYNIKLCKLYYPPYNFERTGCKGCPFNIKLQSALDTLQEFFPNERKQCEIIWKPVYAEYRRIGYRLKKPYEPKYKQMTLEEVTK